MNLHEYQAKKILSKYNLPIPTGYVCKTNEDINQAIQKIKNKNLIAKCQIHAGGRGKSGGVKLVKNKKEIQNFFNNWIGKKIVTNQTGNKGKKVNQILIEEATEIFKELYLSITINYDKAKIIFIGSTKGGIEIEKINKKNPKLVYQSTLNPLIGPMPYQARRLAFKLGLINNQIDQFTKIFIGLAKIFLKYDLTLIEINPLAITKNGNLVCLDSKINIDDNALYRQTELQNMKDLSQEDPKELQASIYNLNYVSLDGNIGCMVNGAGLAMGTMDMIKLYGGNPANFLDIGGNVTQIQVKKAIKIITSDTNVKVILINIFGGIVRCDLIANGVIDAIKNYNIDIPIIVRFEGNNSDLGNQILRFSNIKTISLENNITYAIKTAIKEIRKK